MFWAYRTMLNVTTFSNEIWDGVSGNLDHHSLLLELTSPALYFSTRIL